MLCKLKEDMHCCPHCPYKTRALSGLRRHIAGVHNKGVRPFACDVCGATFTSRSNLNHHLQLHGSHRYTCSECGFSTALKRVMDIHVPIHSEERPFKCDLCEYRTKRKSDLSIHRRCMHSEHAPRKKKREEDVSLLLDRFSITYRREFTISFRQSARRFARIDFFIEKPFGWIVFEVDERQHSQYKVDYECQRMASIFQGFKNRCNGNLHVIRYNPDPYKTKDGKIVKAHPEERTRAILEAIRHEPQVPLTITYLFYRSGDDGPEIALHPDYSLRQHVRVKAV